MPGVQFTVDGRDYVLNADPEAFTIGELGMVEKHTGMSITEFGRRLNLSITQESLSAQALGALAWIAVRRGGNLVDYDEFVDALPVMSLVRSMRQVDDDAVVVVPNRAERRTKAKRA